MDQMSQIFFETLKTYKEEEYLYFYFRYHLAPVIEGLKPASTLTITKFLKEKWSRYGAKVLKKLGVKWKVLVSKANHIILLIYNQKILNNLIKIKDINQYLNEIGYPTDSLENLISFLIKRYTLSYYPHEIGVLLGIPLEDVKIFINNPKYPYILKGYWKVYTQPEKAKILFKKYDEVRYKMLKAPI